VAEIIVPQWVTTQMLMPAGRRYGKRPVFVEPQLPIRSFASRSEHLLPEEGPFKLWEYRFWAMTTWMVGYVAECRACGVVESRDTVARSAHLSSEGCAKKLCAAYKLLLRDNMCVICNTLTRGQRWGVPICGDACELRWKEQEAQPLSLMHALALVQL
jgi:hypothetical protein